MTFDPYYRTPHLAFLRREDGKQNLKLYDGRPLLREWLDEAATQEDLRDAATKELYFLVIRDLVDILPLLRQSEHEPFTYIRAKEMDVIRKIAFLRGRLKYITTPRIKKLFGDKWSKCIKYARENNQPIEYFYRGDNKVKVFSCDFVASLAPSQEFKEMIFKNGTPGGQKCFQDETFIYSIADEKGVVINTIPDHPLEMESCRTKNIMPEQKKKVEDPNDLLAPPDGIITGSKAGFPMDEETMFQARKNRGSFKTMLKRLEAQGEEKIYTIESESANRFDFMRYIPWALTQGKTLREICTGINGCPSMMEIAKWSEWYPDFSRAMAHAEQIQAHVFADQAQEIVMSVSDKEDVPVAKLQSKFLMDRAAMQAEKFRPKQVIQTENLNDKNTSEIKNRLRMLILSSQNVPAVKDTIPILTDKQELTYTESSSSYIPPESEDVIEEDE